MISHPKTRKKSEQTVVKATLKNELKKDIIEVPLQVVNQPLGSTSFREYFPEDVQNIYLFIYLLGTNQREHSSDRWVTHSC